jgi:prephenate dehydratase
VTSKAPPVDEKLMNHTMAVRNNRSSIARISEALGVDDYESAAEAMAEVSRDDQIALWAVAPTKGGAAFTTKERDQMKSDEWGAAMKVFGESHG